MTHPLRRELGKRLHRIIDDRVKEKAGELVARAIADHDARFLLEHRLFGPADRLRIHPSAKVNDALFNTVSGTIVIEANAFFGHGVAVVTGTHDADQRGAARQTAVPASGRDVVVGAGAWVSSRATVIGPCVIGRDAVVAAGAVVVDDVPAESVVAGVPARVVRRLSTGIPPALDAETSVGRLYLHPHDEVLTPAIVAEGGMTDPDIALMRELVEPGATVVDVGANIGFGTLTAAAAVGSGGHVIAVEPHPANLALLRANLARNGADQVTVVPAAAWRAPGEVVLSEAHENTGDHRVETHLAGRAESAVAAVRLDDVVPPDAEVALVKLDTQATEHIALEGARALLDRCRPTLLAEFWPQGIRQRGDDPAAVLAAYSELGYEHSVVEDPSMDGADDAELIRRVDARPAPFGGFVTLLLRPSA